MNININRIIAIAIIVLVLSGCVFACFLIDGNESNEDYTSQSSIDKNESVSREESINDQPVFEQSEEESETSTEPIIIPVIEEVLFDDIPVAALYEYETLRPIYEQNVSARRSPASLTKLVTACVALQSGDLNSIYTVGTEMQMVALDSSVCGIKQGQQISLHDLLKGLLMCSGNDAAHTIAVNIARTTSGSNMSDKAAVEYFCGMMNSFVQSIGMQDSCFLSPDGYEKEGQHTNASDLLILSKYASSIDIIASIASTPKETVTIASGEVFDWLNSNWLLHSDHPYYDQHAIGLKTGNTRAAGKCLISVFEIEGKKYISIILGCATDEQRYKYTKVFIDYVVEKSCYELT